jgi:hypothetical protein
LLLLLLSLLSSLHETESLHNKDILEYGTEAQYF